MIGKTNALSGGGKLKYASGTATTAYTTSKTNGYYFLYADITGLDFQPIAAYAIPSHWTTRLPATNYASFVAFNPDDMSKALIVNMHENSIVPATTVFVESNIRDNGCVIPMNSNTDSYSSNNTYQYKWIAVGV